MTLFGETVHLKTSAELISSMWIVNCFNISDKYSKITLIMWKFDSIQ